MRQMVKMAQSLIHFAIIKSIPSELRELPWEKYLIWIMKSIQSELRESLTSRKADLFAAREDPSSQRSHDLIRMKI